jgi:hypothetical protein
VPYYYGGERPELLAVVPRDRRRVLELGCGVGAFASEFLKTNSAAEYWAWSRFTRRRLKAASTSTGCSTASWSKSTRNYPTATSTCSCATMCSRLATPFEIRVLPWVVVDGTVQMTRARVREGGAR